MCHYFSANYVHFVFAVLQFCSWQQPQGYDKIYLFMEARSPSRDRRILCLANVYMFIFSGNAISETLHCSFVKSLQLQYVDIW